jgi:hypothetical protein
MGRLDFTTCQSNLSHPLSLGRTQAPGSHARGLSVPGKHHQNQNLGKQRHLRSGMIGHDHRRPCAPDSRYLSIGIHPVTTWHRNFTTGTRIITMITMTLDKFALIKAGFSIWHSIHQGTERSTPCQMGHPWALHPWKGSLKPHRPM